MARLISNPGGLGDPQSGGRAVLSVEKLNALKALDRRVDAILPSLYQSCYNEVEPVSMGSAKLKFDRDGKVAWDEIWTSYCDLAIAGGPPHRGRLLRPVTEFEASVEPERCEAVTQEIGRGIALTARLGVLPRIAPGWIGVCCRDETMAGWLARAIMAENVFVSKRATILYLPAAAHFRLERQIKNVVTAVAKTCHYWTEHMSTSQREAVAAEFSSGSALEAALLEPSLPDEIQNAAEPYRIAADAIRQGIRQTAHLPAIPTRCPGWVKLRCASAPMAAWLLRAMVVQNVLARREDTSLCLPVRLRWPVGDAVGKVLTAFQNAWQCWQTHVATR